MNETSANQTIKITLYWKGETITKYPTLTDKYEYYKKDNYYKKAGLTEEELEELRGRGFLGVSLLPIDTNVFLNVLQRPFSSRSNFFFYITLPFSGLTPFRSPITDFYITPFYGNAFWILANSFYWIFWLNFAIGTFNALPAVPLDGGYLFKDGISWLMKSKRLKKKSKEKIASAITTGMSLLVFFSILSILIIPRLLPFFE
jgi:membrane-associated protease RseP (regulator of RpoE activity)